ncbi:MAG: hypothetical protein KUG67_01655 [Proteobacteria bacterium]|nr:hypothetical protein [Pseudomonadota bacterium]
MQHEIGDIESTSIFGSNQTQPAVLFGTILLTLCGQFTPADKHHSHCPDTIDYEHPATSSG